jgi:hypothetical protein
LEDLIKRQPVPGVTIVGLGEHVDYWNQLGWTDRFSSSAYSQRQRVYARNMKASEVYTPQTVINGTREALGSDRAALVRAVTAARDGAGVLTVSRSGGSAAVIQIRVLLSGAERNQTPELFAAVTDDDDTTMVTGGENGGHSLHYTNTVRSLKSYGSIADGQPKSLEIQLPPNSAKRKMHIVVFAQLPNQGRVIAAADTAI